MDSAVFSRLVTAIYQRLVALTDSGGKEALYGSAMLQPEPTSVGQINQPFALVSAD